MHDLRKFHSDYDAGLVGRVVAALIIAALIGITFFFLCRAGVLTQPPQPVVTNSELPSPGPVPHVAPKAPPVPYPSL